MKTKNKTYQDSLKETIKEFEEELDRYYSDRSFGVGELYDEGKRIKSFLT